MECLKVASKTDPKALAGAITKSLNKDERPELIAIGAGAVNQAVKAIVVARGYVATGGRNLICTPGFVALFEGGEERTGIRFTVEAI